MLNSEKVFFSVSDVFLKIAERSYQGRVEMPIVQGEKKFSDSPKFTQLVKAKVNQIPELLLTPFL